MSEVNYHTNTAKGIDLTEAAKKHLLSYLNENEACKGVRFSVKKTGCSGLSYVVDYVNAVQDNDLAFPLTENYKIYIDKSSYPFLKGLAVDYRKQGLNAKFVFDNPNQTGQCGCGESFTVDEKRW